MPLFVNETCADPRIGCRGCVYIFEGRSRIVTSGAPVPWWPLGHWMAKARPCLGACQSGGPLTARLVSRVSLALGQCCPECGRPLETWSWGGHQMPSERLWLLVSRSWGSAGALRGGCWPEVTGCRRAALRGCGACHG